MEHGKSSKIDNINWDIAINNCKNLIASGTKSMKIKSMIMLANYSKHAPKHLLSTTIPILTDILHPNDDNNIANDSLQEAAAYCLKCIACKGDGNLAIQMGRHGVTFSLIRLLPRVEEKMRKVLIKCLLVVVSYCSESRIIVATNGGLEIIINLLNSCRNDVRLYLLEILSAIALQIEGREEIIRLGGLCFVVEAVGVGSMISRERACQSVGLFGVMRHVGYTLVELGVIPVIVELFRNGDDIVKRVAGNTLGVISAYANCVRFVVEAGGIPIYAELLQGHDACGKAIAEDMFSIMAIDKTNVGVIIGHLVIILREGDDEAKAAAVNVIWDLLGYNHTPSVVRDSGVIPILVELLENGSEVVKVNVSGAFALLSYVEDGRMTLANSGAIPILVELLRVETEAIRFNVVETLSNFNEDPLYHDRVSDVVNISSFRNLQNTLIRIRVSNQHNPRPLRRMNVE